MDAPLDRSCQMQVLEGAVFNILEKSYVVVGSFDISVQRMTIAVEGSSIRAGSRTSRLVDTDVCNHDGIHILRPCCILHLLGKVLPVPFGANDEAPLRALAR